MSIAIPLSAPPSSFANARFDGLLPDAVVLVEATPAMWEGGLMAEEGVFVHRAVDKRRREFTAGRNAARCALAALGCVRAPILVGERREPLFPQGISGSITHATDYCAAAVVRIGRILSIGIDADTNMAMEADAARLVVSDFEMMRLRVSLDGAGCEGAKLAFCIKEAFYKAYYQQARQFLDWRDAEIDIEPTKGAFQLRVLKREVPAYFQERTFHGRFCFDAERIYAAIALRDLPDADSHAS